MSPGSPMEESIMTTHHEPGSDVNVLMSPAEGVASLFMAADLPVGKVEFVEPRWPLDAAGALEDALSLHHQDFVAEEWSCYKRAVHRVASEGGSEGGPVPSGVRSPLCRLDEVVALLSAMSWRTGYRLAMAIAQQQGAGAVAVRLPKVKACPRCHGHQVASDVWHGQPSAEDLPCPACEGTGVVDVTPDLLVLGGSLGVLPLPVRVVRT